MPCRASMTGRICNLCMRHFYYKLNERILNTMTKIQITQHCEQVMAQLGPMWPVYRIIIRIANGESYKGKNNDKETLWADCRGWYNEQIDRPRLGNIPYNIIAAYDIVIRRYNLDNPLQSSELGMRVKMQANKVKPAPKPVTNDDRITAESSLSSADIESLFEQPEDISGFTSEFKPGSFRYKIDELVYLLQNKGFIVGEHRCQETTTDLRAKIELYVDDPGQDRLGHLNVYHGKKNPWHVCFKEMKDASVTDKYNIKINRIFKEVK